MNSNKRVNNDSHLISNISVTAPPKPSKLAQLREVCGLSQKEMADLVGRSVHTIRAIEQGKLALGVELARKISQETGVAVIWLKDESIKGPPVEPGGFEITRTAFELRSADKACDSNPGGLAVQSLIRQLGQILLSAEKDPNFILCVWRVSVFLDKLRAEFPLKERSEEEIEAILRSAQQMASSKVEIKSSGSKKKRPKAVFEELSARFNALRTRSADAKGLAEELRQAIEASKVIPGPQSKFERATMEPMLQTLENIARKTEGHPEDISSLVNRESVPAKASESSKKRP
jgi:transcriptional regulator with XRE-family HTH domain